MCLNNYGGIWFIDSSVWVSRSCGRSASYAGDMSRSTGLEINTMHFTELSNPDVRARSTVSTMIPRSLWSTNKRKS